MFFGNHTHKKPNSMGVFLYISATYPWERYLIEQDM